MLFFKVAYIARMVEGFVLRGGSPFPARGTHPSSLGIDILFRSGGDLLLERAKPLCKNEALGFPKGSKVGVADVLLRICLRQILK